jgi:TolA-binding protein
VSARAVGPAAGSTAALLQKRAPLPHRDSWQTLVMHGEFEAVVAAANEKGLQTCLSACSAPELRALADAARYTNRVDLAEQCLLALRQRFADSGQSQAAAFLLGRTGESRGRTASAQHWYEVYLAESPDGEFAADALAGRMRTVAAARGNAAARSLAREYLRRYPDGVHATSASRIAGPN